jgi:hypothetical protein
LHLVCEVIQRLPHLFHNLASSRVNCGQIFPESLTAKVRHGMHRAQRRGRENMLIQAILTAAAMNLRKLAQHTRRIGVGARALAPPAAALLSPQPLI